MQSTIFSFPITIKQDHIDIFGHVNNASYLTLFENARWEILNNNGYTQEKMKKTKLGPVVLKIELSFLSELFLKDNILIQSKVIMYKNKIGKMAQKIIRDDKICCEAEFTIGLFDLIKRKLVLPTDEWIQAIGIK